MVSLKKKVQDALDETRILVLSTQVLLSFEYLSTFQKAFTSQPQLAQQLHLVALALLLVTIALLLTPVTYHQIVERGNDSPTLLRVATRAATAALLPLASAVSLAFAVVVQRLLGITAAIVSGVTTFAIAMGLWWGWEVMTKERHTAREAEHQRAKDAGSGDESSDVLKLHDKIHHVLTEARVVLPGAQAIAGFSFSAFLMESFAQLPPSSKYAHLTSLAFIMLSIILLITPAAYHRIVEEGEDSEHFHRLAAGFITTAMVPLALGLSLDFYVVARKVTDSVTIAVACASLILLLFFGLWFGFTAVRRAKR
jgi:hypothetical protein